MGGALRHLSGFVNALALENSDYEHVVCADAGIQSISASRNVKVFPVALKNSWARILFDQFKIPAISKEENSEVLISLLNFGTINSRIPQIVFQRNALYYSDFKGYSGPIYRLKRFLAYRSMCGARAVITPTLSMKTMIQKCYPDLPDSMFHVIPHGFSPQDFVAFSEPLPTSIANIITKIPPQQLKILVVGHPASYKGFDILVKALAKLKSLGVEFFLLASVDVSGSVNDSRGIKGYDEAASQYGDMVIDSGISERVYFLGWIGQDCIANLYKVADIFVFPSFCESFGFPMLEAMSCGLPIVAADTPTNREILGPAGMYYSATSFEGLTELLLNLANDQGLRESASNASIEQVRARSICWREYSKKISEIASGFVLRQ